MKNNKGLTLIEVILTMAILGIVSISILVIFGTGIKNIASAGNRTEAVFEEKKSIDYEINNYEDIEDDDIELEIEFDQDLKIKVKGKIATSSEDDLLLKTFVPMP